MVVIDGVLFHVGKIIEIIKAAQVKAFGAEL
jgi:hypothetical protein